MLDKSPYLNYLYVFLILFTFGLGLGILRNNFKKPLQYKETIVKPSVINGNNSVPKRNTIKIESNKISEKSKVDAKGKNKSISLAVNAVKNPSPSLEQIQSLIDAWLLNKSQFLEGKTELNLSKIVRKNLINRLSKEREADIQKEIYKVIDTQIQNIELLTQTSSRIAVSVDLKYSEKIFKNTGELVNETSFTPFLKVKYILGFSNKSWKLVDYISGV